MVEVDLLKLLKRRLEYINNSKPNGSKKQSISATINEILRRHIVDPIHELELTKYEGQIMAARADLEIARQRFRMGEITEAEKKQIIDHNEALITALEIKLNNGGNNGLEN